ncbi:MAE_28990/MAE_18760 family HEPN-like nuclease [Cloacibacillus sp.]
MQATIDIFEDRVREITLYYDALKALYKSKDEQNSDQKYYEDDFLKILKSNALLMVYNLVESTIMGGIIGIYDDLQQQGITYQQVRQEIRDIWFIFKFNQVYDKKAHYNSYREKAIEIINSILTGETLVLDRKAANVGGNLDAKKIRQVCNDHGISFQTDPQCHGGLVLSDVKEKRNNLAHGTLSFVECGRDYSINDLERIKVETILFLQGIIDGMKIYYDRHLYLRAAN